MFLSLAHFLPESMNPIAQREVWDDGCDLMVKFLSNVLPFQTDQSEEHLCLCSLGFSVSSFIYF